MAEELNCQKCGAPLAPDMSGGTCPRCLAWSTDLLDRAFDRVGREFQRDGKAMVWEHRRGLLLEDPTLQSYAQVAARLGRSEAAVRQAVYRLRRRFRKALRQEIAETGAPPEED